MLTSNLPFARWGEVYGEATIASAMIDRIVHHAAPSPSRHQLPHQTHHDRVTTFCRRRP
ncbi:ATP-binding protein [Rhodococcoides kroppenstedtii]|uniref:ATP-binding protein n=1 Tax=Rhodococcoides kroppenstedtii TaxID=293050 RepID=UPI0028EDFC28|nr:ATP-binding protein [Rhodococcus kroppenstedtii]